MPIKSGHGTKVRVFLFDYRKAFNLIDHGTLVVYLKKIDILNSIANWIINFLSGRSQRVKLNGDCLSEWENVPIASPRD